MLTRLARVYSTIGASWRPRGCSRLSLPRRWVPHSPATTRPPAGCRTRIRKPPTTRSVASSRQRHGDEGQIVFADVTQNRDAIESFLAQVAARRRRHRGRSRSGSPRAAPDRCRADHDRERRTVTHPPRPCRRTSRTWPSHSRRQGVDVEFSGPWFGEAGMPASEIVGILAAIIVLLDRLRVAHRDGPADPHRAHRDRHLARRRRRSSPTCSPRRTSRRRSRR